MYDTLLSYPRQLFYNHYHCANRDTFLLRELPGLDHGLDIYITEASLISTRQDLESVVCDITDPFITRQPDMSSSSSSPSASSPSSPMSGFSSHTDHAIPSPDVPDTPRAVDQPVPTSPKTAVASGPGSGSDQSANTRRCFVCLGDENESTLPEDWTMPCSCSLEGHHECLLAWVTDLEAQAKDVKCIVCKSPILITERYDLAIQLANFLNDRFSRWSPRILLGLIVTGSLVSSAVYGIQAISCFAGPEAAMAFYTTDPKNAPFIPLIRRPSRGPTIKPLPFGILTLIAPALVINRLDVGDVITLPASLVVCSCRAPSRGLLCH